MQQFTVKTYSLIILFLILVMSIHINVAFANVQSIELVPEKPVKGDTVKILVKADPNEEVPIRISLKVEVAVSSGKYKYEFPFQPDVQIPLTPNAFTVTVKNVTNLYVSVKISGVWVNNTIQTTNGIATMSQSNVPTGTYNVMIQGDSVEGTSQVDIIFEAETKIRVDQNGNYQYTYNTSYIPLGEFIVKVGDITRTFSLA